MDSIHQRDSLMSLSASFHEKEEMVRNYVDAVWCIVAEVK